MLSLKMIYERVLDSLASAPSGTLWKILVILFHLNHQIVLHPSTWPWDLKRTGLVQPLITSLAGLWGRMLSSPSLPHQRRVCPCSALWTGVDSTLRGPGLMQGSAARKSGLVYSCCFNQTPQEGWFINNKSVFLTFLKTERSKIKMSAHLMSGEELFLLGVPSHGRGSKRDYIGDHLSQEDAGIQKWPVLLCIFHSLHRQRVACPSPICPHPKEEGFSTLNMDDPRRSITLQLYSQHSDLQFLFRQRCIESSAKYTGQR